MEEVKRQLDAQHTFNNITEVINHLSSKKMIAANSIWIARDYSIGALVNDLRKINEDS